MSIYKVINYILVVLVLVLVLSNIYLRIKLSNSEVSIQDKVVYITDTLILDSIQIKEKVKYIYSTLLDTIIITEKDTIKVLVPIEHKRYHDIINKDSILYDLKIDYSGYKSLIDNIELNSTYIKQETKIIKNSPWRCAIIVGPYIGYGILINPTTRDCTFGPEIGICASIGFGYTFKRK